MQDVLDAMHYDYMLNGGGVESIGVWFPSERTLIPYLCEMAMHGKVIELTLT